ncbi:MAG: ISL3 family transposase [Cyanobacteria bacterium J06631_12]
MELLHCLLPSLHLLHLDSYDLAPREHHLTLNLTSTQAQVQCPICGQPSHRVHSRYERTLADLPCVSFSLTLIIQVCKFFCNNPACPRRIFTERFPEVAAPWARKTQRLVEHLQAIALTSGGQAGARLCVHLGLRCCGSTLLNLLSRLPLPPIKTPRILGVDDFALRRGQHYGTILVDLETHRPIALLPDRTAETLEVWLKAHPGIEILSRDRSKTYRSGMKAGAPEAIQVADRFHLLQNLEETLEKAFQGKSEAIKSVEIAQLQAAGIDLPELPKPKTSRQQRREEKRAQRLENYNQVHALRKQGYKIKDIAHHLGMGKRTVYTYLSHDSFPEWQLPPNREYSSGLDPYKSYLIEQWQQGKRHAKQLFEEIQQHGFTGSYAMVARYLQPLRQSYPPMRPTPDSLNDLPGRGPAPKVKRANQKALSARRVAWLILQRSETLDNEQEQLLEKLAAQPELSEAISLAQGFLELVRNRLPEQLDDWLKNAMNSSVKAFQTFAKGLTEDYEAVKAGVTLEVSNGQVEGQNNRLKMLKRQMFGRAGLDLLAKRFILT